ncbi:hypothetical protein [Streptomyces sp. Caat 7-52]|uniref:hypothetical protein n=1 Tax=Streptomyces sp. Caat 7-52 TaxID=2949637 RepID=UPI002035663B|nr:hypothetical protein [Streptomyces sp. Caat 7-52]
MTDSTEPERTRPAVAADVPAVRAVTDAARQPRDDVGGLGDLPEVRVRIGKRRIGNPYDRIHRPSG